MEDKTEVIVVIDNEGVSGDGRPIYANLYTTEGAFKSVLSFKPDATEQDIRETLDFFGYQLEKILGSWDDLSLWLLHKAIEENHK